VAHLRCRDCKLKGKHWDRKFEPADISVNWVSAFPPSPSPSPLPSPRLPTCPPPCPLPSSLPLPLPLPSPSPTPSPHPLHLSLETSEIDSACRNHAKKRIPRGQSLEASIFVLELKPVMAWFHSFNIERESRFSFKETPDSVFLNRRSKQNKKHFSTIYHIAVA
jgi:hypothetical protein